MQQVTRKSPIGVFDSGVGGLSVLRELRRQLPNESTIYFGDQGHVPYGLRAAEEVVSFSAEITRFLLRRGVKIVVVACNTASAAALKSLRGQFPQVDIVGMEPAVKPAAETTATGTIGVLATPATFQGALYASVVERFGSDVEILRSTCPGLVECVERGDLDGRATRAILEAALRPMLRRHIDTVVLACTHFPFVIPLIEDIVGPKVRVVDPAPAIARQTRRLLSQNDLLAPEAPHHHSEFFTSAKPDAMLSLLPLLLGESNEVRGVSWTDSNHIIEGRSVGAVGVGSARDDKA